MIAVSAWVFNFIGFTLLKLEHWALDDAMILYNKSKSISKVETTRPYWLLEGSSTADSAGLLKMHLVAFPFGVAC